MEYKYLLLIGIWLLCSGAIAYGWHDYARTRQWLATAVLTQGEVVSIRKQVNRDMVKRTTHVVRYPTIAFRSPTTGQRIEFETKVGNNLPFETVGKLVGVYYQPANPADARLNDFFELWFTPLVFIPLGLCFIIAVFIDW